MKLANHLEKLNHFKLVVDKGSFSAAAKSIGQSQPTLMYSVSELEKALNVSLLSRSREGVRLTKKGHLLYDFTVRTLKDAEWLEGQLNDISPFKMSLTVASHGPILSSFLASKLSKIRSETDISKIKILSETSSQKLMEMVRTGTCDLAIVSEPESSSKSLQSVKLVSFSYQFYCSPNFKKEHLKGKKSLTVKDLNQLPLLFKGDSIAGKKTTLAQALEDNKILNSSIYDFNDLEQVKSFTINDEGIGILPNIYCLPEQKVQLLVPLKTSEKINHLASQTLYAVFINDHDIKSFVNKCLA